MKKLFSNRKSPEVSAGSMADIAFLLLIFFLVTTTIASDKGVLVKLPPWMPEPPEQPIHSRNILKVSINANDELLVLGNVLPIHLLSDKVKEFILNPEGKLNLSTRPQAAIVSLIHDRSSSYVTYLSVYNELKKAYNELWDHQSSEQYGKSYAALTKKEQQTIRNQFPLVISEAEPTDYEF